MADETLNEEATGSAIAALTLAQMTFWHLLQRGLLEKSEAERMLQRAVESKKKGGPIDQLAAAKLAVVLETVQAYRPPDAALGGAAS